MNAGEVIPLGYFISAFKTQAKQKKKTIIFRAESGKDEEEVKRGT
jgi:hypothetical protein